MSSIIENVEETPWQELNLDDPALQNLLDNASFSQNTSRLRSNEHNIGFDNNMGDSWIYPNNLPCRAYQMNIVQTALYHNTLVVLPTGLGKTFIAAVVMYNFYRWYPRGKLIFLAPTKPLVHQQIEACQKIMPFPKKDVVELTGKLQKTKRAEMWKTKRVFFATPHVVQSDMGAKNIHGGVETDDNSLEDISKNETIKIEFPFDDIKLIVIDEAHKAKGKYAYTEVTQVMGQNSKHFRVLALSATPGRSMDDVAEVCRNLFISRLEVRWDTSIDVTPYIHKRSMKTIVVSVGDKIKEIREQLLLIIDPYLRQLIKAEVLSGSLTNINRNFLLYEQKHFRERSLHYGRQPEHAAINSNFAICISLYHALELLERHGLRVFLNNFEETEGEKNKFVFQMDRRLRDLVENLKKELGPNPFEFSAAPMTNGKIAGIPKDLDFGHPKFEKARECLLYHFEHNKNSRAIVFCEYRESVMLIYRMLLQHVPLLQPRCFVGQGGTGSLRALTQKQQIQIMNDFRSGKSNILIATSIGEEGIDVGEVELIVCFDISTSNPIRFVQRIGRTGRNKNGKVIILVTEGREQQLLEEVLANKDQTNKRLLKSHVIQQALYKHSPRLVPAEFRPKCVKTYIKPPIDDEEPLNKSPKVKKIAVSKSKTIEKGVQDLRKFFNKKPKEIDKEDLEFFEIDSSITQAKPGIQTQQNIVDKLDKMKNLFKDLQTPIATQTQETPLNTNVNKHVSPRTRGETDESRCSVKKYFNDSNLNNKNNIVSQRRQLNDSRDSLNDLKESIVDLCDDDVDVRTNIEEDKEVALNKKHFPDSERMRGLEKFFKMTCTTPEVLQRAKINDMGYHLKSKEMSREMKKIILTMKPDYIKENLEQMRVLAALPDSEISEVSEDEKSIKEINKIILDLFGGLQKVEDFLQDLELKKIREKCLISDNYWDNEDPDDIDEFRKKLDKIFEGLGDGKRHDNFEWIDEQVKQTQSYKEFMKSKEQNSVQESMIYDTYIDPDDEGTINNFEDFSITESKYSSHWQEFNKPDIAFKSTPLQGVSNRITKRGETIKRNSFLNKLEETKERENEEISLNISNDSKQIQNNLEMLGKKLKENCLGEINASPQYSKSSSLDDLDKLENTLKAKREEIEKHKQQNEEILTVNSFENCNFSDISIPSEDGKDRMENTFVTNKKGFGKQRQQSGQNLSDEEALFEAAIEAELKFAQNQTKYNQIDISNFMQDNSKTPNILHLSDEKNTSKDDINTTVKLSPSSLDATPELEINSANLLQSKEQSVSSTLPTPPDLSLHKELDINMEAFLEPFPEEQELMKSTLQQARRENFEENSNTEIMGESPDDEESLNKSPKVKKIAVNKCKTIEKGVHDLRKFFNKKPKEIDKEDLEYFEIGSSTHMLNFEENRENCLSSLNSSTAAKSPQKISACDQENVQLLKSPISRSGTDNQKYEKSPSLFEMYLKNTKGKGKLPKSLSRPSASLSSNLSVSKAPKDSSILTASQPNESFIVMRRRDGKTSKRKIFDSDSEETEDEHLNRLGVAEVNAVDSDFEEIAATQGIDESSIIQQRRKRRRFNSFIEREANVSGMEGSEDEEANHTIGCYMLDSVVVRSDDEDPDQASTSHMQAMYLQSLKSPRQRRGTFKIPAPRIYNDHSRIFSQAVLPDETYSQYLPDSFIVEEDDVYNADVTEVSMCPLEKAEQILKEKGKAKKFRIFDGRCAETKQRRKRLQLFADSSDDNDDDDFE